MIKVLGIFFVAVTLYVTLMVSEDAARTLRNHQTIGRQIGMAGILVLGVAPLIIAGGIDLSIGSVLCLSAVGFALLIKDGDVPPGFAALIVLALAPFIGLFHGLLVTKVRLQPFLATLFGLFIYRGLARWITDRVKGQEQSVGLSEINFDINQIDFLALGSLFGVPWPIILFLVLALIVGIFLHLTVYGRYFYAIGANEQAARYAGIPIDRYKIFSYMWCSLMAGLFGILYMLEIKSVSPATDGSFYELYAITGAVLGGCSLRGGDGTIFGMMLGATILPLLRNLILFYGVADTLQFIAVGVALLLGTVLDEFLKRRNASRS